MDFFQFKASLQEKKGVKEDDPCWDSHKQVGMKKKNGKDVPNCVPKEDVQEAKKKIHSVSNGKLRADVIKLTGMDDEGDPFIVKLFKNGKHHEPADYYTDDKGDAIGTAKMMVKESVDLEEGRDPVLKKYPVQKKFAKLDGEYKDKISGLVIEFDNTGFVVELKNGTISGFEWKNAVTLSESVDVEEDVQEAIYFGADNEANVAGRKAARQGVKYSQNPHKKGSSEHLAWSDGHNQGRTTHKAKPTRRSASAGASRTRKESVDLSEKAPQIKKASMKGATATGVRGKHLITHEITMMVDGRGVMFRVKSDNGDIRTMNAAALAKLL